MVLAASQCNAAQKNNPESTGAWPHGMLPCCAKVYHHPNLTNRSCAKALSHALKDETADAPSWRSWSPRPIFSRHIHTYTRTDIPARASAIARSSSVLSSPYHSCAGDHTRPSVSCISSRLGKRVIPEPQGVTRHETRNRRR